MAKRKFALVGIVALVVGLGVLVLTKTPNQRPYANKVNEIISSDQTYAEEHIDKLVELGPNAVPEISSALEDHREFPMQFVHALARIGDSRGVGPILTFLKSQAPYDDNDGSFETSITILALKDFNDASPVDILHQIMRDPSTHPRVTLAAATALSRISSNSVQSEARQKVLQYYSGRFEYLLNANNGFTEQELYPALIDVDTTESLSILIDLFNHEPPSYLALPVIEYFSKENTSEVVDVLANVASARESYDLNVRIAAMAALLKLNHNLTSDEVRDRLNQLVVEADADGWDESTVARAKQLKSSIGQ